MNRPSPRPAASFHPAPRGTTAAALETPKALTFVAPQSPRPSEMLSGVVIDSGDLVLSASDLALHELLLSRAYERDREMTQTSYEIPLDDCLRFLGPSARHAAIRASREKMHGIRLSFSGGDGRNYSGVQMLTSWEVAVGGSTSIGYQFPDPIRALMRHMPSYGYIELAALGRGSMRSKYSVALYKHLAYKVAQRPWTEGGENRIQISWTPDEFARVVDWKYKPVNGVLPFGKLRERVLQYIADDFKGVRKFDVHISYDGAAAPKPGTTTQLITFDISIRPDPHYTVRSHTAEQDGKKVKVGAADDPRYRINSVFWLRVCNTFPSLGLVHFTAHPAWFVALQEALDEEPLSPGYHTRRYRGERLLAAVDKEGPQSAAWGFFAEESELGPEVCHSVFIRKQLPKADKARLSRLQAKSRKPKRTEAKAAPVSKPAMTSEVVTPPPAAAEAVTFGNCTHAEVVLDPACSERDFEDFVRPPLSRRTWAGHRRIKLSMLLRLLGKTTAYERVDFDVEPENEDELIAGLKKVAKWVDGPVTYKRILA